MIDDVKKKGAMMFRAIRYRVDQVELEQIAVRKQIVDITTRQDKIDEVIHGINRDLDDFEVFLQDVGLL